MSPSTEHTTDTRAIDIGHSPNHAIVNFDSGPAYLGTDKV